MIEGSGSGSIPLTNGSGSIPLANGSGSRRPKKCGSGGSGSATPLLNTEVPNPSVEQGQTPFGQISSC